MFESEVNEVRNKLAKCLRLWREAEKLKNKIHKAEDYRGENLYYIGLRLDGKINLYQYVSHDLDYVIIKTLSENLKIYGTPYNAKSFKELCNKIKNITKENVLNKLKETINSEYNKRNGLGPEVVKDTIIIGLNDYQLPLLLSSLNILINDNIETAETIDKARKVLKDCNTFVYRDIKITIYKNGKTNLVFADKKIFNKFMEKFIND